MSTQKLFKFILASTILLPVTFTGADDANAQNFKTRQNIINGLQIQTQPKHQTKRKKHRSQRSNQQVIIQQAPRQNNRVVKRRAPPKQQIQVSAPKQHRLRVPPANNGQLGVSRVPPSNPQLFRVPPPRDTERVVHRRAPPPGNAKFRAPPSDVDLSFRRAPQQNQNQQIRAPKQNASSVESRPPNRNPQHFNSQVTNVVDTNKDRAIRVEQNVANYYDNTAPVKPNAAAYYDNAASVDLEILFDYNSARISPESVRQLFALGEALQDVSLDSSRILIAGHTDAAGSNAYNNDLSYRRAQSVSDFLINYAGVPSSRLATEGYGEELLKYPDAPNSGQNRRVEIINLGG